MGWIIIWMWDLPAIYCCCRKLSLGVKSNESRIMDYRNLRLAVDSHVACVRWVTSDSTWGYSDRLHQFCLQIEKHILQKVMSLLPLTCINLYIFSWSLSLVLEGLQTNPTKSSQHRQLQSLHWCGVILLTWRTVHIRLSPKHYNPFTLPFKKSLIQQVILRVFNAVKTK